MVATSPLTTASRVRLVPFLVRRGGEGALVGRADGSEWVQLDTTGLRLLEQLDEGATIGEIQSRVGHGAEPALDVLSFARELEALGFLTAADGNHGSSRVLGPDGAAQPAWAWPLLVALTAVAGGSLAAAVASGRVAIPRGTDLLLAGVPLPLALLACGLSAMGVVVIHELAHWLVGRHYGLAPRLRLGARGIWLVAQTDLTGVWALPARVRWHPIVAGPMADILLLAASMQATTTSGTSGALGRMLAAVLLSHLLWQLQWYTRTDVYFLLSLASGALNLRDTAWLLIKRALGGGRHVGATLDAIPPAEVHAARIYLISLPIAAGATFILWWWLLVPFASAVAIPLFIRLSTGGGS